MCFSGPAALTNACVLAHLRDKMPQACLPAPDSSFLFQMNNVVLEAATDVVHTKDGTRLFVQAHLLDYSGSLGVGVVEEAVPSVYGLSSKEMVESHFSEGRLSVECRRVNCRGILRHGANGQPQLLVGAIALADISMMPGNTAKGLSYFVASVGPQGPGVVCTDAANIRHSHLLGLCVVAVGGQLRHVKLACILVKGAQASKLDKSQEGGASEGAYMVRSSGAVCLLSESSTPLDQDLVGYCADTDLLDYSLGTEVAVVYVSGAHARGDGVEFVVDRMQKVVSDDLVRVREAMRLERDMALQEAPVDQKRSAEELVTPESAKRCRTIQKYPTE